MNLQSMIKNLCVASAFPLAMAAVPAHAALVSQGVTFTFEVVDSDTVTLRIEDLLDATGDWATVTHVEALGIKGVGNFSAGTSISRPDAGTAEIATNVELNEAACPGPGGGPDAFCFTFDPLLAATNDMLFTINFGDPINPADPEFIHLKVNFTDSQGNKIGDLLSLDVPINGEVSEPGVLGLFGFGLLLLGFMRRRAVA